MVMREENGELVMTSVQHDDDWEPPTVTPEESREIRERMFITDHNFTCWKCDRRPEGTRVQLFEPLTSYSIPDIDSRYYHGNSITVCSDCWHIWDDTDTNEDNHGLGPVIHSVVFVGRL